MLLHEAELQNTASSRYTKESDEVYYAAEQFPLVGKDDVEFLKRRARESSRLRCRLCLHKSVDDALHEMLIVFRRDTYFRPLRHTERPQSFEILEGAISLAILDERGEIVRVLDVGALEEDRAFKTRVPPGYWYSFIFRSEWLVIQEITTGPMLSNDREYAPFAPPEGDARGFAYSEDLRKRAERFVAEQAQNLCWSNWNV